MRFDKFVIPDVKQPFPPLKSDEIVSTQPMKGNVEVPFKIEYKN